MLARFATGASFSADSRGGGKESNAKFLPFMIQMARHLLDHDSSQQNNLAKSITTYLSSPAFDSKFSTSPGPQHSAGTEETVQFMMCCVALQAFLQDKTLEALLPALLEKLVDLMICFQPFNLCSSTLG
ncbi:UNVERIFIED_CONTAM: Auxin transport protein BIG [Sesamum calycinum]|uniref:Auxin transport protein BIG n=1 Tax=Sesamum calycinum TaxID=2727403 RepID=A0AAW2LC68_9LAMI